MDKSQPVIRYITANVGTDVGTNVGTDMGTNTHVELP
jgi:hypothetical protein